MNCLLQLQTNEIARCVQCGWLYKPLPDIALHHIYRNCPAPPFDFAAYAAEYGEEAARMEMESRRLAAERAAKPTTKICHGCLGKNPAENPA